MPYHPIHSTKYQRTGCRYREDKKSRKIKITKKNADIPGKIQNEKFLIKSQNRKLKNIQRMDTKYYIPYMVTVFSNVENGRLSLVLS